MYELDIGTRDKYIDQIEKQICAKRELLMNKRRTLQDANGKNKYLTGVRNDYLKYQQYIMGQRKKQMDQMNIDKFLFIPFLAVCCCPSFSYCCCSRVGVFRRRPRTQLLHNEAFIAELTE